MSDRILVSTRKGLFVVARGDNEWSIESTSFLGDNVSLSMHDPRDGALYAALDHGHFGVKMHRSDDGGATWSEIGTPAFPEKPDDDESDKNPWKMMSVWALEPGGPGQPGQIWMGTIPGGLFVTHDRGDSWELVRSLWDRDERKTWFGGGSDEPGIHSIAVDRRNEQRVVLGISCGGVWVTEDGGETWACRADGMRAEYLPPDMQGEPNLQDPHCIVQCRDQPERWWCQHHNGIFVSNDDCASWQEIEEANPSVFGFAVSVHPENADTAWFVPAIKDERRIPVDGKVVVGRTRDGGKTFDVLRSGLPQEHAYDITFRHALDVDAAGTRLAFGSTTGSLWVTEDQGDSWQTVSEHLPPVYAVRFVG